MVRTLRKKFITASMIAITALIVVMLIAINIFNIVSAHSQMNETMDLLVRYDGERSNVNKKKERLDLPGSSFSLSDAPVEEDTDDSGHEHTDDEPEGHNSFVDNFMDGGQGVTKTDEDTFLTSSYFTVRFDSEGNALYIGIDQIASMTEDNAVAIAKEVYATGTTSGRIGSYIYSVVENEMSGEHTVILLDTTDEQRSILTILLISCGIGVICWLAMLALIIFLSRKAINPIAENIERQKQFVTNAGHELKTPLAIIQANTEAMELFNGENKWSRNIKSQVTRLSELTQNLLTLSRMDESADSMVLEKIDLSALTSEHYRTFADSFSQKGVTISSDIQENVSVKGDRKQLTQLLNLLFDNAVKYTNEGGTMNVSLTGKGSKSVLTMTNTCEALPTCPADRLFDRFYRSDESHTQKTGGQGIGLSVAASIAENHNASLTAEYNESDSSISFIVKF